ncbi:hypothetical protein ACV229_16460 [Burkholderia sp. MR1-5-21]
MDFAKISNNSPNDTIVEYSDRSSAIAAHDKLRAAGAPPVTMGKFYLSGLTKRLWTSQATLAADLRVSKSIVSRSVRAAQLPQEVIESFSDPKHVSFRTSSAITLTIRQLGTKAVIDRAVSIRKGTSAEDVRSILLTGHVPRQDAIRVRLSLGGNRRYVRIDSPNIDQIVPLLSELESLIHAFLPSLARRKP